MGLTSSRNIPPVASIPDSYIAVSICRWGAEVRVMNANQDVEEMLARLDQEIINISGVNRGPRLVNYYGTLEIDFGATAALGRNMRNGVLICANLEYFGLRLIEEMYILGYNLMVSSDLDRYADNGTWFFAKSEIVWEKRAPARVCVITPGSGQGYQSNNKLILMRHDEKIKTAVKLAIEDGWPSGVTKSEDYTTMGEKVHVFSFGGLWGYVKEAGIHSRKTMCSLVGGMGELHWRLLSSSNLRGAGDAYFFIYDPAFSATPSDFCMLALAKKNRLRLINCDHLLEPLEKAITLAGFSIHEKLDYHGCNEIRLLGIPWWATGPQAIAASRSLSRIMEVFGQHNYTPLYAIDVSRRPTEKGSILFRKNPFPMNSKYACLSLNGANTLRLLDFPPDICVSMKEALYQFYPMGVRNEVQLSDSNLEINVLASPWAHFPNNYNKKAGCQLHMRGVLGKMMAIAAQFGWYVSISADVSCVIIGKRHHPLDVNSLYFVKLM